MCFSFLAAFSFNRFPFAKAGTPPSILHAPAFCQPRPKSCTLFLFMQFILLYLSRKCQGQHIWRNTAKPSGIRCQTCHAALFLFTRIFKILPSQSHRHFSAKRILKIPSFCIGSIAYPNAPSRGITQFTLAFLRIMIP